MADKKMEHIKKRLQHGTVRGVAEEFGMPKSTLHKQINDYSKVIPTEDIPDNRAGRLHDVKTDRGDFRFKENRK